MRGIFRNDSIGRSVVGLRKRLTDESGMALMTVLVFGFVFLIGTLAFFAVAGFEAGQTEIRENSSRAFYLADGTIEKAKAELRQNGKWRAGYAKTNADGGAYRMAVDSTFYDGAFRTRFYAEGFWGRTKRDVEVIANIVPISPGLAIHASGNMTFKGGVCLDGYAHANGTIIGTEHIKCGGTRITTWDHGEDVNPPPVYTEPDSFPGATYYYVTATPGAPGQLDTLWTLDRNRVAVNFYPAGVNPHTSVTWSFNSGQKKLMFDVEPTDAFDQVTGPYPRLGGDFTVVINFGGWAGSAHELTDIPLHETGAYEIQSTIINTRYTGGVAPLDRVNTINWVGGNIPVQTKTIFAPLYCVGLICQSTSGNAQVSLGTSANPCLSYIMGSVDFSNGQWSIHGSLISLGDMEFGGGVDLTYDPNFIDCLPPSLRESWPVGTGGKMEILAWREPPTAAP